MYQRIDAQRGVGEDPPFIDNVLFLLGGIVCFFKGPQIKYLNAAILKKPMKITTSTMLESWDRDDGESVGGFMI